MIERMGGCKRMRRTCWIVAGGLWLGAAPAQAGMMDTLSSGVSYVTQGVKNKANAAVTWVTDSAAGKFVNPAERNKRDRERILSVLSYEGAIYYDDNGKPQVKDQRKLDKLYQSLQSNDALKKVPGFSKDDDPDGNKSGQFWQNFLGGKDYTRGDTPAVLDPFENDGRGLATKMHTQLTTATDDASTEYTDTAGTLKVRGIDILEKDLRQGVAAGADTYIKALDAITGGTSSQAVKWMEDAAKKAKEIADDPRAAAEGYVKDQIEGKLDDLKGELKDKIGEYKAEMIAKADESLKKALGEDGYKDLMDKYEAYGEGQERIQKIFEDMARVTGDERLADAAKKMKEFSPDEIADNLSKTYLPEILQGEDDEEGEDDGEDEEDAEEDGEGEDDEKDADGKADAEGPEAADKGDSGQPADATPPPETGEKTEDEPTATNEADAEGEPDEPTEPETTTEPESPAEPENPEDQPPETPESDSTGATPEGAGGDADDTEPAPENESGENDADAEEGAESPEADEPESEGDAADADKPGETTTSSGYVEDSNGRITLTETRDANGNVVRTGTVETDKDGKVIGKTTYEGGTGEGQTTGADSDLRGAEPESDADVDSDMVAGGVNTSGDFAGNWTQSQTQRGADGSLTMAQNTQMDEAANAGNQTIRDADSVADAGGRDAQNIRDASTRATAKSDRENSWGKALGDAVEQGITEGGKAFGEALGGAAADEAVGEIFGTSKDDEESASDGEGETETGAATPTDDAAGTATGTSGKDGGKKDDRDDDDDDECDDDDDGDSDDPLGVTGKTKNKDGTVTIRYGCGYSWTGKPPGPSRCPICSRETVSTEENETPDDDATDAGDAGSSGSGTPGDADDDSPGYSGDAGSAPVDDGGSEPPDDIDCPFATPTEKAD